MYSKFAPDDHGTRFSSWQRSEDVVSRVACGVYHFNPCSQTTVKRKKNTQKPPPKILLMVVVLVTLGLRHKLPFRDVPM